MSGVELFRPAPSTSCQLPSLPGYRGGHTLDGLVLCGGQDRARDEGSRRFHNHGDGEGPYYYYFSIFVKNIREVSFPALA